MTIYQQGGANPAALGIPGAYINIQPPPAATVPGAPSDIVGIVGVATWGPVNSPVAVSTEAEAAAIFGPMVARKHDLLTQVHTCQMQGARNFRLVRQTDGSETAASATVQTNGGTATSKYPGSRGALIKMEIANGTKDNTKKVIVTIPGLAPETFDNIAATAAANASWVAIAAAINAGIGQQGPSQIITFAAGVSTAAPVNGVISLTGGTDGVASIAQTDLIGSDTAPREGMYALRNTGLALLIVADADDNATWSTQQAFAISEACQAVACGPSGDTLANFATDMAGIDNPWVKVIFGDWPTMIDGVNGGTRLVSPQGFYAGVKVAIGPHQSALNKPLNGIVTTQKATAQQLYSTAELQAIKAARGDVIVMQSPGGDYPSFAFGRNSSSDVARGGDQYTTMTNYLARSLDQRAGVGRFVGRLATPDEEREAKSAIGGFLQVEWDEGRIGNVQGTVPYSVEMDSTNVAKGIQAARVQVQYLAVIEYFLVDLTGGQTVEITTAAQSIAAAA